MNMLSNDYLSDYLLYLIVEKGLSENTYQSYKMDIQQLLDWLYNQSISLSEINNILISNYRIYLKESYKTSTIARKMTSIKGFLDYIDSLGILQETIAFKDHIIREKKLPIVLTEAEITALIQCIPTNKYSGKRDAAILELMYATGIRVSELVDLTQEQYYEDEMFIRVIGKGNKERLIPFGNYAKNAVNEYLQERKLKNKVNNSFLFLSNQNKKISRQSIWKMIKKYAKMAGINQEITPHTIRHTFATHLLNNGVDLRVIQELLGHSDISTTQIYVHIAYKDVIKQYNACHPRSN